MAFNKCWRLLIRVQNRKKLINFQHLIYLLRNRTEWAPWSVSPWGFHLFSFHYRFPFSLIPAGIGTKPEIHILSASNWICNSRCCCCRNDRVLSFRLLHGLVWISAGGGAGPEEQKLPRGRIQDGLNKDVAGATKDVSERQEYWILGSLRFREHASKRFQID